MNPQENRRNLTTLTPVVRGDLDSPSLKHFHSALRHKSWFHNLDWSQQITLTTKQQELAHSIASQSCHAEQIGMLTATALLLQADDPMTRLTLATAVRDESVHVHTFSSYATLRGGFIEAPIETHDAIQDWLLGKKMPFIDRLLMHTLAESFAMDQFYFLSLAFRNDLLGTIYAGVLSDESRHVRLGMEAVACYAAKENITIDFNKVGADALRLSHTNDDMFTSIAEIVETPVADVRERYLSQLSQRLKKLKELIQRRKQLMTSISIIEPGLPPIGILAYQSPIRGQVGLKKKATKKTKKAKPTKKTKPKAKPKKK